MNCVKKSLDYELLVKIILKNCGNFVNKIICMSVCLGLFRFEFYLISK